MENKTVHESKTIEELLKKATEEEYFAPALEECHGRVLEFLRTLKIAEFASLSVSSYYNRRESTLKPDLQWMVGQSKFRVKVLLVTEIFAKGEFERKWEHLGLDGLKNVDPLAPIIEKAFTELSYSIDIDSLTEFDTSYENSPRPLPFYPSYMKPINTDKGFLRVWVFGNGKRVIMPETNVEKIITTHLRFYKNSFPKPHGTGKDSIAL